MDQQALTIVLAIITSLVGFITAGIWLWVNNLWSMVRNQQEEINALSVDLAKNYVPRAELQRTFDAIFIKLEEIYREMPRGPRP